MTALVCLGFCSCGGDDEEPSTPETALSVDVSALNFTSDGQSQTFRITSNADWTITGNPNWLSVSPASGSKDKNIVVTASENTSTSSRSCQLHITTDDGKISETISVQQAAQSEVLSITSTDINIGSEPGSSGTISITSNTGWNISGASDWLTLSSTSGDAGSTSITVTANSANKTDTPRECVLSVKAGQITKQITVRQAAGRTANCKATPTDFLILTESIVYKYDFNSNVHHICFALGSESLISNMTDDAIIKDVEKFTEDQQTATLNWVQRTPAGFKDNGDYFSYYGLNTNSKYTLVTVSYDSDNKVGYIHRQNVVTRKDDIYESPYIDDTDLAISYAQSSSGDNVYRIQVTKDGSYCSYAKDFYSWAAAGTYEFGTLVNTDAQLAVMLYNELKKNPQPHDTYFNSSDRSKIRERIEGPVEKADYTLDANITNDKYMQIINWCRTRDGEFSGRLQWYWVDLNDSSTKKMKIRKATPARKSNGKPKFMQFSLNQVKKRFGR